MSKQLEERVAFLEAEVTRLRELIESKSSSEPEWRQMIGIFADDPGFAETVRLGREYRDSDSFVLEPEDTEAQVTPTPVRAPAALASGVLTTDSKEPLSEGVNVHS